MLHKESLQDFARSLHALTFPQLGCPEHEKEALGTVLKFYILLRFRFFIKGLNKKREDQRQRLKLMKLRSVSSSPSAPLDFLTLCILLRCSKRVISILLQSYIRPVVEPLSKHVSRFSRLINSEVFQLVFPIFT